LSLKVKIIRCDNRTEFKNSNLNQFCGVKGIKREFSVPRTPQQNDSLLSIPFWDEAVNTACYVQNRVLVTKPHNKTPYELLHGRLPSISFMRPFGCSVTILNTLDPLGKFQGKVDEGFLVGYSVCSKAFRVFNSRTSESDSSPHAHAQSTKTYYKHHDSRIKKAQDLNTKTFANSDIQDLPLRYQDYQGRLLASFQEDAKDYGVPTLTTLRPQQMCLKVWLMRTSLTFLIQKEGLMSQMFLHLTKRISQVGKLALRLKFNAFKSLEGEKVNGTFTRLTCLLNDLENNGVSIPQAEVNATFVNSLPRKWMSINQTQMENHFIKNDSLATLYGKYNYEEDYKSKYKELKAEMALLIKRIDDMTKGKSEKGKKYPEIHPPSQEISDEVFQTNHSVQYKENLENSSNSNQEKEGPLQDSDIRQLIREECCVEVSVEQKQSVPILSTKEPEHSLSMGYEHLSITPETKPDEVTESNAENLLPIPSECEVTSEDKRECDMPVCEDSSIFDVCDNHSEIFSDSKNDDDISVYDDDFEDIEYVEASLPDPEIVSVEEENVIQQEEEEVDLEDISQIQDVVLREKLLSITRLISNIESLNENPTPDCVLNSFEFDNSLSDNFSPEFETFCDYTEETRSEADLFLTSDNSIPPSIENVANDSEGDIRFLEELLIDVSILSHESSDSYFEDIPSIPRPPPKPPDAETDVGEEIPVVMNDKDKFDEDYSYFMFDKDLPSVIEVFLCWIFVSVSKIFTSFDLKLVWGSPYPLIYIA
nr:hypothetical protein [Tanacetum cinerariifolium]